MTTVWKFTDSFLTGNRLTFLLQVYGKLERHYIKFTKNKKIFKKKSEQLFRLFYNLLPKNWKLRENLDHTEEMFKEDLKKQLAKFIITDALYSSEIFTNIEGVFFRKNALLIFFFLKEFCF